MRRSQLGEAPPPTAFFGRFQRGFERYFERFRQGYLGLLQLALAAPLRLRRRLSLASPCCRSASRPFSGRTSFPRSTRARSRSTCARRPERGSRKRPCWPIRSNRQIRAIIPPDRLASIVDNIGLPVSGINISYGNSGTIGVFDADILVTLRKGTTPTDGYVKTLREQLPRAFPGTTFSFLPGRYRQPDPQLRLARADRRADRRRRSDGEPRLRQQLARKNPPRSRHRRSAHPGSLPGSRRSGSTSTAISRASSG